MTPSRDRSILGIISIILLLAISHILFASGSRAGPDSKDLPAIIFAIALSFNIVILLAWISFGIFAGIVLSVLSSLIALAGILRSGCYNAAFISFSFILTALAGYNHWKITEVREYAFSLDSEKLEEDINIFSDDIQKKRSEIKRLEEKFLRYLVLKDVAEALTTTLTLEDIAKLIIERTSSTLKKRGRSLLYLVDIEKQDLMLSASQGALKVKAKKGDIFDRWVLKHGIPLIVEDVTKDFRFSSADSEAARKYLKSLIVTPLLSGNKVIGVLRMDSDEEGLYTQDDLRLLDIIGNLSAVAIQNAFLYSWIQDLAIRDSLTGLFVRRYFLKRFQEEIGRSARNGGNLSLLMLDIDRFKWYNDKYGHATGDLVLKHITSKITSLLHEGDMAARYGGEEIAVLLIGADIKKALKTAESIRKNIEELPLVVRRETHGITVSIGVSSYPQDSVVEEELTKIADERLYKAKSLGRNKVCAG